MSRRIDARAAGHADIAAAADLHRVWAQHTRRDNDKALTLLASTAATEGDPTLQYRIVARVLTALIARKRGDKRTLDAVIAAMAREPDAGAPVLVYNPPYPAPTDPGYIDLFELAAAIQKRSGDAIGLQWVDTASASARTGRSTRPKWFAVRTRRARRRR